MRSVRRWADGLSPGDGPALRDPQVHAHLHGLSGSGKSTIASVLLVKLLEMGGRPVTLLDGDLVRRNLSSELDFSRDPSLPDSTRFRHVEVIGTVLMW